MDEKFRTDTESIIEQTDQLNERILGVVKKQMIELAKKTNISEMPKLQKTLEEEQAILEKSGEHYYKLATDCLEAADTIKTQLKEFAFYEKNTKKGHRFMPEPNLLLDYKEQGHFASGMNYYKSFLIFFMGCFGGVVVESLYCIVQNGYYQSRVGLIWGPFNLVYGIGALCLSALLYKFRNRSAIYSVLGGFIIGTVIEFMCSWFQETFFGSTSWDYTGYPFNISGRVCLLYSLFWGALGIFWIKGCMPVLSKLILKIPNKIGKKLVIALTVFMLLNSVATGITVFRWSQRVKGVPAYTAIGRMCDDLYPNERMQKIFANLHFKNAK